MMNILAVGSIYNYSYQKTGQTKAWETEFSEELGNRSNMDPLDYYKKMCEEFPDITFRLDDKAAAMKHESEAYLGYNNSMNQIGKDFGGKGRCSISMDVSVIEKMQKDPRYEEQVKGMIEDTRRRYSEFEADAAADGEPYVSVVIEDNHGIVQRGVMQSKFPYSTEEEVKKMWAGHGSAGSLIRKFALDRQSVIDDCLERLDGSHKKQEAFWRKHKA